jgi:hypothetical protein
MQNKKSERKGKEDKGMGNKELPQTREGKENKAKNRTGREDKSKE